MSKNPINLLMLFFLKYNIQVVKKMLFYNFKIPNIAVPNVIKIK